MRSISRIARGLLNRNHWRALFNSFAVYRNWFDDFMCRYVLGKGHLPKQIDLRTPVGVFSVTARRHEDLFTVHEIFGMACYPAGKDLRTFVDFGGNIGVSAGYFLTRNNASRGIIFEPLGENVQRLSSTLIAYIDRVEVIPKAVFTRNGMVRFGVEPTGRYSGIGLPHEESIDVESLDVNDAIRYCLQRLDHIDILKIDIEGAGVQVLRAMDASLYGKIKAIMIEEVPFDDGFLIGLGYTRTVFDPLGLFHYTKN